MTTEYGGEATARATRGTVAHRALLASESGVVGRWEYYGTAAWRRDDAVRAKADNGVGRAIAAAAVAALRRSRRRRRRQGNENGSVGRHG